MTGEKCVNPKIVRIYTCFFSDFWSYKYQGEIWIKV